MASVVGGGRDSFVPDDAFESEDVPALGASPLLVTLRLGREIGMFGRDTGGTGIEGRLTFGRDFIMLLADGI